MDKPADTMAEAPVGPPLEFGEMRRSASFIMRLAELSLYEQIYARIEALPVSLAEITVMAMIAENPDARQGELADALKIKWPRMTKLVRVMEAKGWVERIVPEGDSRAVMLRLTKVGAKLTREMRPRIEAIDLEVTGMLTPAEQRQLLVLLSRVLGWEDLNAR